MSGLSSLISQCPQCSRVLSFSNLYTNFIICASCGSIVWRKADGSLQVKPQHLVSDKTSIIQPGTTGTWNNSAFTVLGRFRAWFEETVFNYWTVAFDNGEIAWLAEGYGLYYFLTQADTSLELNYYKVDELHPGDTLKLLDEDNFILDKKQKTLKWDIQGELFIPATNGFRVWEFSSAKGKNICLFEFEKGNIIWYESKPAPFESLRLKNLASHSYSTHQFICKKCSNTIKVKTFPYAQSCACLKCGTFYSLENGMDFRKLESKDKGDIIHLSIGSVGILNAIQYEVIGYARKEEENVHRSKWKEYTLYNPQEGYAFLSEYEGHWIYLREKGETPVLLNQNETEFDIDGTVFELFNSYSYKVIAARGEFPYNIFDNNASKAREFVCPPYIWIQERDRKEGIKWFYGQHVERKDLQQAFSISSLPLKRGIGAVQPLGAVSKTRLLYASFIAVLLLMIVHFTVRQTKQQRVLFEREVNFYDSSDVVGLVTEKFKLEKRKANIEFHISAAVANSWFELNATLVNVSTGKEYSVEKGVEYYFGFDSDGSWSEGSSSGDVYLTRIPSGTYFIQLQGTRENAYNKPSYYYVRITYDVPSDRNLVIAILLVLMWPAGRWMMDNYNEKRRWSNSPYSNTE